MTKQKTYQKCNPETITSRLVLKKNVTKKNLKKKIKPKNETV